MLNENNEFIELAEAETETTETVGAPPAKPAPATKQEVMTTSLGIMGKGMLGIFIVTAVIILTIFILNKTMSKKKKD